MSDHTAPRPRRIKPAFWLILATVIPSGACHDRDPAEPNEPDLVLPGPAIISNPVALAAARAAALVTPTVYVSIPAGTFPGGIGVLIRNTRTGSTVTAGMIAGGLDPVAAEATVGDTLEFTITLIGRGSIGFVHQVPATKPPVIVRTDPPPGKRDVPLNAIMVMVFSEPMDSATISTTSIKLTRLGVAVSGRVTLADDGLSATFQPDAPLLATADYSLTATTGVADLDGDSLEVPVTVPFTTGALSAPPQPLPPGILGFTDVFGHINLMTADGTFFTTLTSEIGVYDAEPAWSPDGTRIAFSRWSDSYTAEIYVMNADGTNQVRLSPPGSYESHPTWSPDGSRIAFEHRPGIAREGAPDSLSVGDIYVMDADGTNRVRLTDPPHSAFPHSAFPAWSPDGEKIAFMTYSSTPDIYVINADGTNRVALTNDSAIDTEPAWSPDGSRIVFRSGAPVPEYRITATELFIVNADGTNRVQLTTGGGAAEPSWAPDGLSILFTRYSGGCDYNPLPQPVCTADLWMVRIADGILFHLPQLGGGTGYPNWQLYPSWRP